MFLKASKFEILRELSKFRINFLGYCFYLSDFVLEVLNEIIVSVTEWILFL